MRFARIGDLNFVTRITGPIRLARNRLEPVASPGTPILERVSPRPRHRLIVDRSSGQRSPPRSVDAGRDINDRLEHPIRR